MSSLIVRVRKLEADLIPEHLTAEEWEQLGYLNTLDLNSTKTDSETRRLRMIRVWLLAKANGWTLGDILVCLKKNQNKDSLLSNDR